MIKIFLLMVGALFVFAGCTGSDAGNNSNVTETNPSPKNELFQPKSAADLRREVASTQVASKNTSQFSKQTTRSTFYYSCDRETLPRTCCYWLMNNGGGVYEGALSCVEENH